MIFYVFFNNFKKFLSILFFKQTNFVFIILASSKKDSKFKICYNISNSSLITYNMNYNDFSILTDSEYVKIAKEYEKSKESSVQKATNNDIQACFDLLSECKNFLLFKNTNNNLLIKELNNHEQTLNKIMENFETSFNLQKFLSNKINNFNLFTYLKMLFNLKINLNNCLIDDNKLIIKNSIEEINNLFITILNILSKLNIKIFKFM